VRNSVEFKIWGAYALFTDPLTKLGGEKCSYQIPTYEALKGIAKSVYWKPTIVWVVDKVRVMKRIKTQTKGTKPLKYGGGNDLAIYTFLSNVEYQVKAHFEWNEFRKELAGDRIDGKHYAMVQRAMEKGGRQDIFLGTRDCQGYVEPCQFGVGDGEYDNDPELSWGLMFHGFDYPDEIGKPEFWARFWIPRMMKGVINFELPVDCKVRKFVREMHPKRFVEGSNVRSVKEDSEE
jgi:CRISPR-associated protein Cas5d